MKKICPDCKIEKDETEYYKSKRYGIQTYCKKCCRIRCANSFRFRRTGVTREEYNAILDAQDHRCAICKRHKDEFSVELIADHNHETGKARGVLCMHCNFILGQAKDNTEILQNCIEYLEHYR
jgi:hypothetical protein